MVDDIEKDELLDALTGESTDDTGSLPSNEDVNGLRAQIDELSKEKHGLLKTVKEERRKRQEIGGRLNQLTETVNGVLAEKQNPAAEAIEESQISGDLPVTFTEDGDAYVSKTVIDNVVKPYTEKITELEQMLVNTTASQAASNDAARIKNAIVGEDERYALANNKYQAARKWVNDQATDFTTQNKVGRALTSGEALDYVFNEKDTLDEFQAQFPGLNIVDIVTAEDSQHHFRTMLSNIAESLNPGKTVTQQPEIDSRFKKVMNKPTTLSGTPNEKGSELTVVEKVGALKAEDILNLSDAQVEALEKALAADI